MTLDTTNLADGVHHAVSDLDYHADKTRLSHSGVKLLLPPSCPAKFEEWRDNTPEPTPTFDFGHAAHKLVLGKGAEFEVVDEKDWKKPSAQATRKQAHRDGKIPVLVAQLATAQAMAAALKQHPAARGLFVNGRAEVTLYATDPDTGVRLRGRPDYLQPRWGRLWIVDYKTSNVRVSRDQFERQAAKMRYFTQGAWYIDLVRSVGLDPNPVFVLVAQETEPPYIPAVFEYGPEDIAEGRRRNRAAIRLYRECVDTDTWPAYPDNDTIQPISLPPWEFDDQINIAGDDSA